MGPTGPSATRGAYFFFAFFFVAFFFIASPPSRSRASRGGWFSWTLGEGGKAVKDKILHEGSEAPFRPYILGRPDGDIGESGALLSVGGLPVLLALHELLIQGDAFLAERAALRRIRREISAHQAEDLLAADLRF